jgi:hypothetical protein
VEIKRIAIAVLLVIGLASNGFAADTAKQVDFLAAGLEKDGSTCSGCKVYTYEAGTTTAKTAWTDREKTTPATNPVVLDSEGRAELFADGVYKMVVKTSADVSYFDIDGVSYGEEGLQTATLSSYDSLAEAVADIGATKTVLIIDATDTLDANVTIPSTMTLLVMLRDAITLNSKTLTVNGDIWAGAFEWVIGSGTFAGSPIVQVYDSTWTASTVTDSATPSHKSLDALIAPIANSGTPNANTIYNGSVIKGWAAFVSGETTVGYNIASASQASGTYTVVWDRDFANTNYAVFLSSQSSTITYPSYDAVNTRSVGQTTANHYEDSGGGYAKGEAEEFYIMVIGTQ